MNCFCCEECVNGHCPNALDEMDRMRDDDAYAVYHLDKKLTCDKCSYHTGRCEDCIFAETTMCPKEKEKLKKQYPYLRDFSE